MAKNTSESKENSKPKIWHDSVKFDHFQLPDGYKPRSGNHGHQKSFSSMRRANHRGHTIKIKTTYRIEIDDSPLTLHTTVLDDGTVHCHGLPNYSFPSAVDLAKSIIDAAGLAKFDVDEIGPDDNGHNDHSDASKHTGFHNRTDGEQN